MEEFLKKKSSSFGQTLISMTPYDIAKVMGHEDVLELLSKQAMENNSQDNKQSLIKMIDGQEEIEGSENKINKDEDTSKNGEDIKTSLQVFSIFTENNNEETVLTDPLLNPDIPKIGGK